MPSLEPIKALQIITSWLEDNIAMESEIIFDNDEDKTNAETLLPALQQALTLLLTLEGHQTSESKAVSDTKLREDFEKRNRGSGGENRYVVDNNTGGYYLAECQGCGEIFPSNECHGGRPIADSGDHDDGYCPLCGETDPDECVNAALAWNVQQKRILELENALMLLKGKILRIKFSDCGYGAVQHMSGAGNDYCNGFVDGTRNAISIVKKASVESGVVVQIEEA